MSGTKVRGWCFTINNFTEELYDKLAEWFCREFEEGKLVYGIMGLEHISDSASPRPSETSASGLGGDKDKGEKTPHIQGYVYWKNPRTWSKLREITDKRAHVEVAKGSPKDNQKYCSKEGNYEEFGKCPVGQGKRTDLDEMKTRLIEGQYRSAREIYVDATSYQSYKMAEIGLRLFAPKRTWKPIVSWLHGPTGCGKTMTSIAIGKMFGEVFITGEGVQFPFDGYEGEPVVIIDDFRANQISYPVLLRLFDQYEYRVNVKGSSREFLAKYIFVTTPLSPLDTYGELKGKDNVAQLVRRLTHVVGCPEGLESFRLSMLKEGWNSGTEVEGNTSSSTPSDYENDNNI